MNILPFVTILILVITLTVSSFFGGYKETSFAKLGSNGLINAFRLARNSSEETRFHNATKAKESSKTTETTSNPRSSREKKRPKKSFRETITDNSKFNLTPLLTEDSPFLQETFALILQELYIETDIMKSYKYDKKALPKLLAKEILQSAKNLTSNEPFEFEKIVLSNSNLHTIWYKMLKGSPNYPDKGSWPPISHFFTFLKETNGKILSGRKASIPALKAFFGEEIANAILAKERDTTRKKAPLTQEELTALLNEHGFSPEKRTYIHYGLSKKLRRTEIEKDPTTGITANVSYSTQSPK